jgi:hypothetical protein
LLGKNLTENPCADEFAREAELKFIAPSMTPEEGEKAYPQRIEEWYMTPSMADAIPERSIPKHGQLCDAIDELEKHFRRETMPPPFSAEPKCAEDWRATVESWKSCTLEVLNRGYNWSDFQWEIFSLYAHNLMEFVRRTRPDLDVNPLSELADFGTARHRSRDNLAQICNHSLDILRSVIDGTRATEPTPKASTQAITHRSNERRPYESLREGDLLAEVPKATTLDDLTPTAWKLLRALSDLDAVNSEKAVGRSRIARKARTGNHDSKHNQDAFALLSKCELIVARNGIGTWLNATGINAAKAAHDG